MMASEEPPPVPQPVKKPPARVAAKEAPAAKTSTTTTAKTTTSAKGPSGPQIQEEDVGTGLSKEEAEQKVQETFSAEIVGKLEESKW